MIKQDALFFPYFPSNADPNQEVMTFGEPEPNSIPDPILDWLEDSVSYLPSFLDDPYDGSTNIIDDNWWPPSQDLEQELFSGATSSILTSNSINDSNITVVGTNTKRMPTDCLIVSGESKKFVSDSSKKRKAPDDDHVLRPPGQVKKPINKRGQGKSAKDSSNNVNNRNGRWAEQLLNPCAAAITAGNVTRVRHLLFVLRELASPSGDANYRLASHGLQALTHHLSSTNNQPARVTAPPINFSTVKPKFFQQSLINFNDINPWFTIPNNIANYSILQVLSEHAHSSNSLHILDIGVSHGIQWPTLLEALSRRPGGPPPLVRLTVVPPTHEDYHIPFANCPPGYNFISNLLRSASEYKINLHINRLDNCSLPKLNAEVKKSSPDETLIVCAQFRLHNLNHDNPDNRTEFLKAIRGLEPKGMVLSDNNMDCSCNNCGNFETGFAKRVDYLWSFLDSTSVAFKGRDMEERKMMEGEASKALINVCEMNENKEKWGERMTRVGFVGDVFREDVMDGARALLRKYDNNWELRHDQDRAKCVGLWWKGQPVSFCSLWKLDTITNIDSSLLEVKTVNK
uniref:protein NODULATION SIGNALING PATHWAY 1-like n=1 Tax=Erigeron canadensis TaxID=72917 RepID=UPI001CB97DE0|nr:protein NODULATION SIGNALING PATHWAY 1-like [Erigeron canadensis]